MERHILSIIVAGASHPKPTRIRHEVLHGISTIPNFTLAGVNGQLERDGKGEVRVVSVLTECPWRRDLGDI